MGRLQACFPISSRSRTVVRLRRPHALSLSVKALWQRRHQNRRLCRTNSIRCPRNGTSRLILWRTSCCLTQMQPQWGQLARSLVPITSTLILPSTCTSCLRMRSPSNSNGTTIPCSWLASFPVICWGSIACPPPGLVFLVLPSPTKDKLFSQFSPTFTLKDGEPFPKGILLDFLSSRYLGETHYHPNRRRIVMFTC